MRIAYYANPQDSKNGAVSIREIEYAYKSDNKLVCDDLVFIIEDGKIKERLAALFIKGYLDLRSALIEW